MRTVDTQAHTVKMRLRQEEFNNYGMLAVLTKLQQEIEMEKQMEEKSSQVDDDQRTE